MRNMTRAPWLETCRCTQAITPVVPIVVRDGHKRWPPKTFLLYPGEFEIEVLEPIDTSQWSEENIDRHIQSVVDIYNDALPLDQRTSESS